MNHKNSHNPISNHVKHKSTFQKKQQAKINNRLDKTYKRESRKRKPPPGKNFHISSAFHSNQNKSHKKKRII
jgi:hypothetical protein